MVSGAGGRYAWSAPLKGIHDLRENSASTWRRYDAQEAIYGGADHRAAAAGRGARSLLAATPADQLVEKRKPKVTRSLTPEQVDLMERESANLDRQFRMAEENYSANNLDLVLARGWLSRLLMNTRVARYLEQMHPDILAEFRKIATPETVLAA